MRPSVKNIWRRVSPYRFACRVLPLRCALGTRYQTLLWKKFPTLAPLPQIKAQRPPRGTTKAKQGFVLRLSRFLFMIHHFPRASSPNLSGYHFWVSTINFLFSFSLIVDVLSFSFLEFLGIFLFWLDDLV